MMPESLTRLTSFRRIALALAGLAGIAVLYLFLSTAGTLTKFPNLPNEHYGRLAVAFADGHTDLIEHPDGSVSGDDAMFERYWDLSLHDGKLYLYWGPVPALIGAALLRAFGAHPSDDQLTFVFALVRAVFGAMILVRAKRTLFRAQPWWPTSLGIVTLVVGAPLTLIFARSVVYEAAIMGAQCFLVVGTYVAFVALTTTRRSVGTPLLLFTASLCWTLAFGCRASQVLASAALGAVTLAEAYVQTPARQRRRVLIGYSLVLAVPMAVGGALLAGYNRVRFGSIFDTGLALQVSTLRYHSGLRFIVPNIYCYSSQPPAFTREFPFLRVAPWDGFWLWKLLPDLSLDSADLDVEPNVGLLWSTPFYAFAVVSAIALARWSVRALGRRSLAAAAPIPVLGWLTACSLALGTLSFAPCLVSFISTVRYPMDVTAGLAFAATIGLTLLAARPVRSKALRGALAAGATVMVVSSILVNFALWVGGPYGDSLKSTNTPLFDKLSRTFSRPRSHS
jgi:prepilin-type processing-associated H-X9-DG protein